MIRNALAGQGHSNMCGPVQRALECTSLPPRRSPAHWNEGPTATYLSSMRQLSRSGAMGSLHRRTMAFTVSNHSPSIASTAGHQGTENRGAGGSAGSGAERSGRPRDARWVPRYVQAGPARPPVPVHASRPAALSCLPHMPHTVAPCQPPLASPSCGTCGHTLVLLRHFQ